MGKQKGTKMSPLPDHAPRRSRRSPITPLADHANHAPPHPLPCHGNCFLLLKHPAQLHAQRKMYQGQVISGLCGLLQVAWACKFIGLKVTSCWERSSSALPAVPKKLICSAFRWLNSLMRGRLSAAFFSQKREERGLWPVLRIKLTNSM